MIDLTLLLEGPVPNEMRNQFLMRKVGKQGTGGPPRGLGEAAKNSGLHWVTFGSRSRTMMPQYGRL